MLILAIDTSSPVGSVALRDQKGLTGLLTVSVDLTHSEGLMPAVDTLLLRTGKDVEQLTAVACTIGPGSYTGLRVGIATGQGIAFARNLPCVKLSSLTTLAWNFPFSGYPVCPVLPARKGWLYAQIFEWKENVFQEKTEELYVQPEELIKEIDSPILIYGPGLEPYRSFLKEILGDIFLELPAIWDVPRADLLAELAAREIEEGNVVTPDQLLPHYLGPSQAEINWKKRQVMNNQPS